MKDSFLDFNENNWKSFKKDLKKVVGETAYNNWLKQLDFLTLKEEVISLSVPTKFLRDWIVNHYADKDVAKKSLFMLAYIYNNYLTSYTNAIIYYKQFYRCTSFSIN